MKKVCHVTTIDMSVRFLLLNQLIYLLRNGFDVHVACSDGEWLSGVEAHGIRAHRVEMKRSVTPISDFVALFSLWRVFRRERFDIIHLHTAKASLLGALAARLAGVRHVVYTIHGFYSHEGMSWYQRVFFFFCEKVVSWCVTSALSQNRADIKSAVCSGLYLEGDIEFLGNGIDIRRFDPRAVPLGTRLAVRKSLEIPEESQVIGIVARLVKDKGYLELFDAVRSLLPRFPGLFLLAVGPRDLAKKDALSPETAEEYGIADNSRFTGMRLDLPELYCAMDIFVLPSYREGFPRSLMEASSMGLPIVASDIRGCQEALENDRTGILVKVRDPVALAEGISRLLNDPGAARSMGKAGRLKALDEFDEEKVFEKVLATYRRISGEALFHLKGESN